MIGRSGLSGNIASGLDKPDREVTVGAEEAPDGHLAVHWKAR